QERNLALDRLTLALTQLSSARGPAWKKFLHQRGGRLFDATIPLVARLRCWEQLGLLQKTQDPALVTLFEQNFPDFAALQSAIQSLYRERLFSLFPLDDTPKVQQGLQRLEAAWGNLDALYAVLGGLQTEPQRYAQEIQVFQEWARHLFLGNLSAW